MRVLLGLSVLVCGFTGCGKAPEPTFVSSAKVHELYAPARTTVEENLEASFGTPKNLVAWLRLPVNYGGTEGTVAEDENRDYDTDQTFKVKLSEELKELPKDSEVLFTSGDFKDQRRKITDFDAEKLLVTLDSSLDSAPAVGDEFVLNPGRQLKFGQALYMEHCVHCHGVSGGGNGPTAKYMNPRPRDYRKGIFKFTTTKSLNKKPSRADLERILRQGIPGTYMPSFQVMVDEEMDAIVEYVRWLSMRGEYEETMANTLRTTFAEPKVRARVDEQGEKQEDIDKELSTFLNEDFPDLVDANLNRFTGNWTKADSERVRPKTRYNEVVQVATDWVTENHDSLSMGVVKVAGDGETPKLSIELTDDKKAEVGQKLYWLSGLNKMAVGEVATVEDEIITLASKPEKEAEDGDQFLLVTGTVPPVLDYVLKQGPDAEKLSDVLAEVSHDAEAHKVDLTDFFQEESERRGKALFYSTKLDCVGCHGPQGKGDGKKTEDYSPNPDSLIANAKFDEPGLRDTWGNVIRPRNLTKGIFRGGRRPYDLYARVWAGIKGTPMNAFAQNLLLEGHDYQAWDLINYLYVLPQQAESRKNIFMPYQETPVPGPKLPKTD